MLPEGFPFHQFISIKNQKEYRSIACVVERGAVFAEFEAVGCDIFYISSGLDGNDSVQGRELYLQNLMKSRTMLKLIFNNTII